MLKSRKELVEAVKNMYVPLLERAAERYCTKHKYIISDTVGYNCTLIEEIFRPLWGIAPIINECDLEIMVEGKKTPVTEFITRVLCEATDPNHENCFDKDVTEFSKIVFANQSVTEIAAYLISCCFAKEKLWDAVPAAKREQIANWVKKWSICAIQNSWPNNHYWYPIFCIECLKRLGYDCSEVDEDMKKGYEFLEKLYYGKGWYSDGALGKFDYYEAWAHHAYTLLWILIADKNSPDYEERAEKYRRRSEEYLEYFAHYFDSDGSMAAYGRSISYRFAAVCPFGLAAAAGCNLDMGKTKSIILKNISYFLENCTMVDGCLPCGYLYQSTGFVETYTCEGSITCYTEGLMCLLAGEDHPLWTAECKPLDIEEGNYSIKSPLDGLEIVLHGENAKSGVTLFNNSLHYYQGQPSNFNDMGSYYSKFAYNSRAGFSIATIDSPSPDNMISLRTADGTMNSHRKKIYDMEYEDGILISKHTPFSNDPATVIKTWLLPLWSGFHVRVHKVTLANPYSVREGGFAIGNDTDDFKTAPHEARFDGKVSYIDGVGTAPLSFTIARPAPGMHLLMPQALCPIWYTDVLAPGEYIFATSVCLATDGVVENKPEVKIEGNVVTVKQGDIEKTIVVK